MDNKTEDRTTKKSEIVSSDMPVAVKVTIHIPDDVPELVKQQKINRIYDILTKTKAE